MSMKVTILGSGTNVPNLSRSACAALVEYNDLVILIDLGPGTMRRLLECGIDIADVTHIFLTHFHPDHTAELVPLLFATKYCEGKPRTSRLSIFAGDGFKAFYQGLQAAYRDWIVLPGHQLLIRELDVLAGETIIQSGLRITAGAVRHRPESIAFRFQDDIGVSVVYSGDTDTSDSLVDLAKGTDLFICESAFPDELKAPGHLTPSLAGRIAEKAGVKQLVLTHLYPPCERVDIVKQAARTYKGPIMVAEDLMTFELGTT